MPTQIRKINKTIDRAQHVIGRHEFVEAKVVEKALLYYESIAHHRRISLPPQIERITAKRWSRTLFQRNPPLGDVDVQYVRRFLRAHKIDLSARLVRKQRSRFRRQGGRDRRARSGP